MNTFAVVILVTLLVDFVLGLLADVLNLKALQDELPADFKDVYDEESYRKSQEYTRQRTRFGMVTSAFDLFLLLGFWALGGFNRLDLWLRGFELGPIQSGLLFIGLLILGKNLLSLPFAAWSTFVIEERFGFNRTTPKTFVTDLLKGFLLGAALGGLMLSVVLIFFERAGSAAWLYCWAATTGFALILNFIFPVWILPLFNRFQPLEDGELRDALATYARSVGFALQGIFVVDGSRRSSRANAFFTGFGANKRIALFDSLVEKHTVPELVAVLAHEVGHYKKKHIVKGFLASVLNTGLVFFLLSIFLSHSGLFEAFQMENQSIYAGLVFFGLLYAPIELVLSLLLQFQLRKHEFEADRFAAETVEEPGAMISALKKLSADNLGNLTPHPFYVILNYSHPPVTARIAALRRLGATTASH